MASIKGHEKYIYHYDKSADEFFDLSEDPSEQERPSANAPKKR
jgi:hypothetical protein